MPTVTRAADPEAHTFYRELRPISEDFVPEALAVSGLDRDRLIAEGSEPAAAMAEFSAWVREVSAGAQPVMCGYPASYDWTFLYWYLIRFTGASPFGHSGCLDMKTLYATKARLPLRAVAKGTMPRELLSAAAAHPPRSGRRDRAGGAVQLTSWRGRGADPGRGLPLEVRDRRDALIMLTLAACAGSGP